MPDQRGTLLALVVATAVVVAPAWAEGPAVVCGRCHDTQAALASAVGGHALSLDCVTCHDDRRPGVFGPGHRAIPQSCTAHHTVPTETHPPPTKTLGPARLQRSCLKCHDPHGSSNAHLLLTRIRTGGRFRPVSVHESEDGLTGLVDPARPGKGLCEICHRSTRFYRANGHGESHFTGDCMACHDHTAAFRPVVTDANCTICHATEGTQLAKPSLHHDRFTGTCSSCHAEVSPDPGPGHRATSACTDCHSSSRAANHVPPGITIPCLQCHDPHGTDNIRLIRDVIDATNAGDRPLRFDNLTGRADGSFASVSAPGTGLCEVCHTQTQFYRADGGGAPHFTTTCTLCHPHTAGFLPQ